MSRVMALAVLGSTLVGLACDRGPVLHPEAIRELYRGGRTAEAEREAGRLHEDRRARFGDGTPEVAEALDVLVRTCRAAGNDEDPACLARAERALAAWEAAVGPDDPRLVPPIRALATVSIKAAQRRHEVRSLIERALAIRRKHHPPGSVEVAEALSWLGTHHLNHEADVDRARELLSEALAITRAADPPDETRVARLLHDLSVTESQAGRLGVALSLVEDSLVLMERLLGPEHRHMALVHDQRGAVRQQLGDLRGAAEDFEQGERIRAEASGADHMSLALSWKARAGLLAQLGDRAGARRLYERALERLDTGADPQIRPATLIDRAHEMAEIAMRLAALEIADGETAPARRRLGDASARLQVARLGSPVLKGLIHEQLGLLAHREGRHGEAARELEASLGLLGQRLAPDHPLAGRVLASLGSSLLDGGDAGAAEAPLRRASAILEGALSSRHPERVPALRALASQRAAAGAPAEALALVLEAAEIEVSHRVDVVRFLPERLALLQASPGLVALDDLVALAAGGAAAGRVSEAWEMVARGRGLALDAAAERRRRGTSDPEAAAAFGAFADARRRLAYLHLAPVDELPHDARSRALAAALAESEQAERRLAALTAATTRVASPFTLAAARRSLGPGGALVAFAECPGGAPGPRDRQVIAFVAPPDGAEPVVVSLGPAARVDAGIRTWREAAGRGAARGGGAGADARAEARRIGGELREMLWDPLAAHLAGASRVSIVPDGALHFLPIAALPGRRDGSFVLEEGPPLSYAGTERDLVPARPPRRPERLVLFGASRSPARLRLAELGGAEREVREAARRWRGGRRTAVVRSGDAATEASFVEEATRADVLHVASHAITVGPTRPAGVPGLRSPEEALGGTCLVLAPSDPTEAALPAGASGDGLLTADEIAALDLDGVGLVVLSACDSGVGTPVRAEGSLGLRRAFAMAGVATQVLALLPLDDEATGPYVEELYAGLAAGQSPADAAHRASVRRLAAARAAGLPDDVRSWGAFAVMGAPLP